METQTAGAVHRAEAARLRALVAALVRRFSLSERADVQCCGLTVAQSATLEALRGQALRLGPLARRLGIAASTLTRNLERLEQDGLVAREADPEDTRAARVRLTAAGERAGQRVSAQEEAFAADILARLGARRAEAVADALADLLHAVREATERCCPGAFDHLMEGVAWRAGDAPRRSRERKGCRTD
jgi:DNA-binding MarR family transcriptional regulator